MSFIEIISWPFAKMLWLFNHCGSYVVAIFFFAIVVKFVTLPFAIKQQRTQIKGAKLRPKIAAIERKYAGRTDQKTLQKKQQEIMDLQKEEGYSPLSGCLPLLIQLPIIIILYNIIQNPLTHILGLSAEQITNDVLPHVTVSETATQIDILTAAQAIPAPAGLSELWGSINSINMNLFGLNTGLIPGSVYGWYIAIPILTALFSYGSMKLTRLLMKNNPVQQQGGDARTSNIIMDLMMPLMSLWFAFKLPALLGVYWIFQSVLGVVQQYILNKVMPLPTYSEEEIRAILKAEKERANASRAAMRQTSYDSRSLHHIDDDDEEDVYIPEIRSKFDDDEETSAPSVKKPETSNSAPQTHQRQRKKKK